ncbi:MAG TPA: methylated-DNA--[protein]-cysteine S-methyltransferase [Acidimicrobiales bacterium]|nr:methylated-DNA--[protein]-cysteine S-methyltransferase [Acidimicrobiales bacterium]
MSIEDTLRRTVAPPAFVAPANLIDVAYTTIDSPIGPLLLAATRRGLVRLGFATQDTDDLLDDMAHRLSPRVIEAPKRLDKVRRELDQYFAGRRHDFTTPLDWSLSKGFRQEVLKAVAAIPFGQVRSYKEMAKAAGSPNAVRAAGSACGSNPIPLIVPCHRVLGSDGGLHGYGGGLDVKRRLLTLEGVAFRE